MDFSFPIGSVGNRTTPQVWLSNPWSLVIPNQKSCAFSGTLSANSSGVLPERQRLALFPLWLFWNKSIPIRHCYLWQSLGVEDVVLFDDVVPIEQKGGQSVHLVRAEWFPFARTIWYYGDPCMG